MKRRLRAGRAWVLVISNRVWTPIHGRYFRIAVQSRKEGRRLPILAPMPHITPTLLKEAKRDSHPPTGFVVQTIYSKGRDTAALDFFPTRRETECIVTKKSLGRISSLLRLDYWEDFSLSCAWKPKWPVGYPFRAHW